MNRRLIALATPTSHFNGVLPLLAIAMGSPMFSYVTDS